MSKRTFTRREFVSASLLAAAGTVATACATPAPTAAPTQAPAAATTAPTAAPPTTAPAEAATATAAPVAQYAEAPMLAELVAAGKLPPVDQRLPENPWVVPVVEKIGQYGGTLRRGFKGVSDNAGANKLIDRLLVWFDKGLTLQPRIAESWEVNDEATVWTWHLRKGMKWSDGQDMTSADAVWWYENVLLDTDITKAPSSKWVTRGTDGTAVTMQLEAPDDYTIVTKFAHSNPFFIYGVGRDKNFIVPGHYLKQFHGALTDDKEGLEAKAKEAGLNSWAEYFDDRNTWHLNPDRPGLGSWVPTNQISEQLYIMERNPYFFGVDAEGKQLPYIDRITHRLYQAADVFDLWITSGDIDFQARGVSMANYPLYKQSEESGDYKVFLGTSGSGPAMQLNMTTKNAKLAEVFLDSRVRIAVSLAINRDEINQLAYDELYTPCQYVPLKATPYHYPKLANAYIEYDPDQANQLLDEAGLKKGADGFRLWKDGSGPLSFTIEGYSAAGSPDEDAVQLVVNYLNAVGLKCAYKYFERSLFTEHYNANDIEASWYSADRRVVPLATPWIWLGTQIDRPWCAAWGLWRNDPSDQNAVKPPDGHWIWDIWRIWDELAQTTDTKKQDELYFQILDIWAEELPMIGVLGEVPAPIIVKNGFTNYLPGLPVDDSTGDESLLNIETYFWEEPEKHGG